MSNRPDIPPGCEQFEESDGEWVFWLPDHGPEPESDGLLYLSLDDLPDDEWRPIIAAYAEIGWKKEQMRLSKIYDKFFSIWRASLREKDPTTILAAEAYEVDELRWKAFYTQREWRAWGEEGE